MFKLFINKSIISSYIMPPPSLIIKALYCIARLVLLFWMVSIPYLCIYHYISVVTMNRTKSNNDLWNIRRVFDFNRNLVQKDPTGVRLKRQREKNNYTFGKSLPVKPIYTLHHTKYNWDECQSSRKKKLLVKRNWKYSCYCCIGIG